MKGTPSPAQPVKFEAALGELETIVADMENGELPLDQLIGRYEEGMRLVKVCHDKLAEAEQKIEVLTRTTPAIPAESQAAEENPGPALF